MNLVTFTTSNTDTANEAVEVLESKGYRRGKNAGRLGRDCYRAALVEGEWTFSWLEEDGTESEIASKNIGAEVREMTELGLSAMEISLRLGVTRKAVWHWLRKQRNEDEAKARDAA